MTKIYSCWFVLLGGLITFSSCNGQQNVQTANTIIENQWHQIKTIDEGGLVGERVDLWRNNR